MDGSGCLVILIVIMICFMIYKGYQEEPQKPLYEVTFQENGITKTIVATKGYSGGCNGNTQEYTDTTAGITYTLIPPYQVKEIK